MIIKKLNDKYKKVKDNYNEILEVKKELEEQLKSIMFLFEKPELIDDESLEELCEILDSEDEIKLRSIKKYLKAINKYPNQSQIKDAKAILEYLKQKLISIVKEQCENDIKSAENIELECSDIYEEQIVNYNEEKGIDIGKVYKMIESLYDRDFSEELIEFLYLILEKNNATNDLSNVNFKYYEIIDLFSNNLKDKISDNIDENSLFVCEVLKKLLNGENVSLGHLKLLHEIIILKSHDNKLLNRLNFLIHLHKVDIPYDDDQIEFLKNILIVYEEMAKNDDASELEKLYNRFNDYINGDEIVTDVNLLKEIFNKFEISLKEQAEVICSLVAYNRIKTIDRSKRI